LERNDAGKVDGRALLALIMAIAAAFTAAAFGKPVTPGPGLNSFRATICSRRRSSMSAMAWVKDGHERAAVADPGLSMIRAPGHYENR
jgi:hypothetical protein